MQRSRGADSCTNRAVLDRCPLSGRGPSRSRATTKGNERCEAVQRRRPHALYPPEPSQRAKRSEGVAVGDDSMRERRTYARKSLDLGRGSDIEIDGRSRKRLSVARRLCHWSRRRRSTRIRVDAGTWTWKPRPNAPEPVRLVVEGAIGPGERRWNARHTADHSWHCVPIRSRSPGSLARLALTRSLAGALGGKRLAGDSLLFGCGRWRGGAGAKHANGASQQDDNGDEGECLLFRGSWHARKVVQSPLPALTVSTRSGAKCGGVSSRRQGGDARYQPSISSDSATSPTIWRLFAEMCAIVSWSVW